MHGGDLRARVRPGGGSTLLFTLPLDCRCAAPEPSAGDAAEQAETTGLGIAILIAEDDELNRLIFAATLTQAGYDVDAVSNGAEAVAAAASQRYELILMDRHMPICDGIEATRQIRAAQVSPNHATPIIALTASTLTEDREACLEAGMNDFIGKPLTPVQLEHVVAEVLKRMSQSP